MVGGVRFDWKNLGLAHIHLGIGMDCSVNRTIFNFFINNLFSS